MPRPLRHLPYPFCLVEVTSRTILGKLLLKPSPELNDAVIGVLGRALARYVDVRLVDVVVLSNHLHLHLRPRDALALARFMGYVLGNVSRAAGRLNGWPAKLWSRRYRAVPVVDEDAMVARLRYLCSHGVKEGLVARALDWPGVSSLRARLTGEPLRGRWVDRTAEHAARRRGQAVQPGSMAIDYEVPLAPLPCWADLSPDEYRRRVEALVREVEQDAADAVMDGDLHVLGAEAVLRQDPLDAPRESKRSPAPPVHASSRAARAAFVAAYRAFVGAHRAAAERLRAGLAAVFPPGCFPPAGPFVPMPLDPAPA